MANLKDIREVPVVKALDGTEQVLLNADGSAKQIAVKDLIDYSSQVPETMELSGEETMLINVNGEIKQVRVDQIKPKEEYDLDITVSEVYNPDDDSWVADFTIHHVNSFETIRDKILNGIVLKVKGSLYEEDNYLLVDPITYYEFEYYKDDNGDDTIYFYVSGYGESWYFCMDADSSIYFDD